MTEAVVEMGAKRAIYFYKREIKGFIPAYSRPDSVLLNLIGRFAAFTFDIFENDEGICARRGGKIAACHGDVLYPCGSGLSVFTRWRMYG